MHSDDGIVCVGRLATPRNNVGTAKSAQAPTSTSLPVLFIRTGYYVEASRCLLPSHERSRLFMVLGQCKTW